MNNHEALLETGRPPFPYCYCNYCRTPRRIPFLTDPTFAKPNVPCCLCGHQDRCPGNPRCEYNV